MPNALDPSADLGRLRTARASDLDAIMALEWTGFEEGIREGAPVFIDRLETFPAGFIVGEDAGGLSGYLCSERWPGAVPSSAHDYLVGHSSRARHDPHGSVLYISSMTLQPALRGRGAGLRFFQAAIDVILRAESGIETCLLIVNETWLPARRIYEAEGYAVVQRLPAFFEPIGTASQDAIVMMRSVKAGG